jgi:hypothetical protein
MIIPTLAEVETLFDYYFALGCPCRFPRLRATLARDFAEVGAREWTVAELPVLLQVFDRRVQLHVLRREAYATHGTCATCGAEVNRFGVPMFQDSFIERAIITPGTQPDIGAGIHALVPICGDVFRAAPGTVRRDELLRIRSAYPHLDKADWLAYMREVHL